MLVVYSTPFLMTGYDRKTLKLRSSDRVTITVEVDISGMGDWHTYKNFHLEPEQAIKHTVRLQLLTPGGCVCVYGPSQ